LIVWQPYKKREALKEQTRSDAGRKAANLAPRSSGGRKPHPEVPLRVRFLFFRGDCNYLKNLYMKKRFDFRRACMQANKNFTKTSRTLGLSLRILMVLTMLLSAIAAQFSPVSAAADE
jgi:hypothetical protein